MGWLHKPILAATRPWVMLQCTFHLLGHVPYVSDAL